MSETVSVKIRIDVVEDCLVLKEGAQVMYIRNNSFGRWANGTLGAVSSLGFDRIIVALEDGSEETARNETKDAYEYVCDTDKKMARRRLSAVSRSVLCVLRGRLPYARVSRLRSTRWQ